MTKRHVLTEENGASAILVIIMMVVLLVFGLAVLTTSLSNVRLGERKKAWLSEYYLLEAEAAMELAYIDGLLLQAEAQTHSYMASDAYVDDYMLDGPVAGASRQQIFALAYDDAVMTLLSQATESNDAMVFYYSPQDMEAVMDGQPLETSRLDLDIELPESKYDKHIQITLSLLSPQGETIRDDGSMKRRYIISSHVQQQEAFRYDDSFDFEDPFQEDSTDANPFEE